MTISQIAFLVADDWPNVYFAARPYLAAMSALTLIDDTFVMDSGRSVVARFLSAASTWRGEVARGVKKELNARLAS